MNKPFCKIFFLILTFALVGLNFIKVKAQIIDNSEGKAFTEIPFFNEDFIRSRKIKSVSGKFIHYKLGDKLRETDFFRKYFFNEKGQLVQQIEKNQLTPEGYLITYDYMYDINGNLESINYCDKLSTNFTYFEYDEKRRVTRNDFSWNYQGCNLSNDDNQNENTNTNFVTSSEHSVYKTYEKQQQQEVYINQGELPYKDIFTYLNDVGQKIEVNERLRRTSATKSTFYSYDENGFIDTIKVLSNSGDYQNRLYTFKYDDLNNLTQKQEYKDGVLITKYEVIYKAETNLINDVLIQDVPTNFIRILELRNYTYYDN